MNPEEMTAALNAMLEQGNQLRASKLVPVLTNVTGKFNVLEDIMGITLDPDLDEKCYKYFTIEATENGTKVYFRQSSYAVSDGLNPLKVEISTNNGKTWTEVTAAPAKDDVPGAVLVELAKGNKVFIRGKNEAYGYYSNNASEGVNNCNFFANAPCFVYGNIMSLVGGDDFARLRKVKDCAFAYFFANYNAALDGSWVLSKEKEELLLPATTLADYCYNSMFSGCTNLTTAPTLPATTLTYHCYNSMFYGCTNLTVAPTISAITLADYCCYHMFDSCTSLTAAPELPATMLADYCYNFMFKNCTSLAIAPALPATTLTDSCYSYMFDGCTSLAAAPVILPATMLADYCYNYMFQNCTNLTTAPTLPATTLTDHCYSSMFKGCTSLTVAPALPATTLANYCYNSMFSGCTNLTIAPTILPATTLASSCYESMFNGCTSLIAAPTLPATTLANSCYYYMFSGCTNLTIAPELPATTLASSCYSSMFYGCTNLSRIKAMFTTTPGSSYTNNWVKNVKDTGTFVKNSAATWNVSGNTGVPTGWTVETASN